MSSVLFISCILHTHTHPPPINAGASVDVCFCYFDDQHTLRAQSSTFTIVDPHADDAHSHYTAAAAAGGHGEERTPFEIQVYRKYSRWVAPL